MIGIGNDIVSLKVIDIHRTQSPQFYSKILSPSEQQLYQEQFTALPFGHFVWLLWSVKESAYKCLQRQQPKLLFHPVKIEITRLVAPSILPQSFEEELTHTGFTDAECFCSEARFESQLCHARSVIYGDEAINTVTLPAPCHDEPAFNKINWGLKRIAGTDPADQSTAVRDFLLERLQSLYPGKQLSIVKNDTGCPVLFVNGKATEQPLSLSHHEEYVGYALSSVAAL